MANENGNYYPDTDAAAAEQILEDLSVPGLSAEEKRLWSIVRMNSLDFDAGVALIEETEKVAAAPPQQNYVLPALTATAPHLNKPLQPLRPITGHTTETKEIALPTSLCTMSCI